MENFLQQFINGISQGSVYALIAIGYTMVYGIIKLINFAHGDIYMVGAFLGYFSVKVLGFSFIPALLTAMIGAALLGVIIEKVAYKPLRNSPKITLLITAIGISMLLQNGFRLKQIAGPNPRPYPDMIKKYTFHITENLQITNLELLSYVVVIVLVLLLQYIIFKTKTGKAMRAASFDMDAAKLMGINVDNVISVTFAIGSSLAAAAGVIVGMLYPQIDPYMGVMPGLKAFVAAVLGGIGILPGAMVGGLMMGMTETMVKAYGPASYSDAIAFAILIIVLLVRPAGLLGKKSSEKV
jgi:branched-chain amino acid transport system permease protein